MANHAEIIARWVRDVRTDSPRYLSDRGSNVLVRYNRLYSYGTHFELARYVKGEHPFWLLNGDTYSVSTSRHQSEVRSAVNGTGLPVVILPHSTLAAAGIDPDSITPLDVTRDRAVPDPRTGGLSILPKWMQRPEALRYYIAEGTVTDHGDGTYTYHRTRHVLGEALFAADYLTDAAVDGAWDRGTARATFLSAFDTQEARLHYFLAQLPPVDVSTVAEAFEALRPEHVKWADSNGVPVTRQGDIFAVEHRTVATRELTRLAPIVKAGRLLGTSHTATEVVECPDGSTFARGTLTHRPVESWRPAEHRRQRMGDGKTWHLIVKNTVPTDRAWSRVGNVD